MGCSTPCGRANLNALPLGSALAKKKEKRGLDRAMSRDCLRKLGSGRLKSPPGAWRNLKKRQVREGEKKGDTFLSLSVCLVLSERVRRYSFAETLTTFDLGEGEKKRWKKLRRD